jgi:rRNA maturation endonuclease Nob1
MKEIKFFRCQLCTNIVSVWDIKENHCCSKCGGSRILETNLSFMEKISQLIKHPLFWRWGSEAEETYYEEKE